MEISDIEGLYLIEDFINREECKDLMEKINEDEDKWRPITTSSKSRRVQHYGYLYNYKNPNLEKTDDIPPFLKKLKRKIRQYMIDEDIIEEDYNFDQCIINEYLKGQGISAHTDHTRLFGPIIVSVSLGDNCDMIFERQGEKVKIDLKPCTLLIMKDDARYKWTHMIPPLKKDKRISITFRKTKG